MKRLIISDVHLGSPALKKKHIQMLTDLINKDWDEVILNGDIFDELGFKSRETIKKDHPELIKAINNKKHVYIKGNHDPDVGILDYSITLPNSKKVTFTHGN